MRHQRRPGGPGGSEVAVTGFRRLKCAQFSVVIAARSNQVVNSREEPPTTPYKVPMTAHAAWRTSTSSRQGNRQQHNHSKRMATLEFECHGHPLSPKAGLQKPACKCHPRAWPTLARKEPRRFLPTPRARLQNVPSGSSLPKTNLGPSKENFL